jgi:hypothetical protein
MSPIRPHRLAAIAGLTGIGTGGAAADRYAAVANDWQAPDARPAPAGAGRIAPRPAGAAQRAHRVAAEAAANALAVD